MQLLEGRASDIVAGDIFIAVKRRKFLILFQDVVMIERERVLIASRERFVERKFCTELLPRELYKGSVASCLNFRYS